MESPRCKICKSGTDIVHDAQYGIDYYACPACEFLFMDDAHLLSQDEERDQYAKHENTPDNEGYVRMFREFLDVVTPHHPSIQSALDFGCGPGPVLAGLLEEQGFDVDVYDPFFAPNGNYHRKKFDLITATEVFEHLVEPIKTFSHLADRLNPGGILALMTLFHPNDSVTFQDWWYRRDPTHIAFYRPGTFELMAEQSDLKCVYHDAKRICIFKKKDK